MADNELPSDLERLAAFVDQQPPGVREAFHEEFSRWMPPSLLGGGKRGAPKAHCLSCATRQFAV